LVNELESGLSAEPSVDPKITTWASGGAQVFGDAEMRHFKILCGAKMRHRQSRQNYGSWVSTDIYSVDLFISLDHYQDCSLHSMPQAQIVHDRSHGSP
jgi:hypothetical protein